MRRALYFFSFCLSVSVTSYSLAEENTLRSEFSQAELTIGSMRYADAQATLKKFADYPLQPYLEFERLKQHLTADQRIADFLQQYKNSPMDWPLRKEWLLSLAKRKQTQLFLANYHGSADAELECYQLRFELAQPNADKAEIWPKVTKLWTVGKSQPKACDALFTVWRDAGQQTPEIVWQRLRLAAEGGDASLIRYLKTLLPKEQQYLADMYRQTRYNPSAIARAKFFTLKKPQERDILAYGLKRLIWRDADKAIATWQKFINDPYFTAAQRVDVQRQFAIALANRGDERASDWFKQLPAELLDNTLAQWQVGSLLLELDWPKVQATIEAFPADLAANNRWQYWLARAYEQQAMPEKANEIFQQLALQRHFYGFMAAAKLGLPPSLAHAPVTVSDTEIQQLKKHPAVRRAQEWLALKRNTEARREWNYLQNNATEQQKLVSAKLAHQLQWYDRAIFSLADVGYWDDIELRFPLAYQDEINLGATKAKVDSGWAMAIARRESSFMADARSPVGAQGLMQLMPATAKEVAKKAVSVTQLNDPILNIDYGTDYLNYLLQRNDGNLLMATAAYNAGYSRVKQWIPKDYALPADIWIETIPYRETREYVKAVMAYYQIYNIRLNANNDVFEPLLTMQIGVIVD
ncbi:transglycosylase SLT domain-containing protein [Rheinheimera sp. WS51]|uniref:transglycosylase SLT domain-containing protein n=1 Tax=Rheinheimera sp. WS51 TaxID=3425886 RepID=UPI003D8C8A7A